MGFTRKKNQLSRADLQAFTASYRMGKRPNCMESERFRSFTYEELPFPDVMAAGSQRTSVPPSNSLLKSPRTWRSLIKRNRHLSAHTGPPGMLALDRQTNFGRP